MMDAYLYSILTVIQHKAMRSHFEAARLGTLVAGKLKRQAEKDEKN
jgi:hypothetical protein